MPALPAPTLVPGYTWRPVELSDAQALNRLLLEVEAVDQNGWIDTLEERRRDFADPRTHIATDSQVAVTPEGQIALMAWLFSTPPEEDAAISYIFFEVHPDHRGRGLEGPAFDWMEARAAQILSAHPEDQPRLLQVSARHHLTYRSDLYRQKGFQCVRNSYRMQRSLHDPIPAGSLPAGVRIAPWSIELDEQTLQASNDAFSEHWGFVPVSLDVWRIWYSGHEYFRPDLSFQALVEDGEMTVAGFSLNHVRAAENEAKGRQEGWIQELAVRKAYRKQGVATALLCATLRAFREAGLDWAGLGVDAENTSGAVRLYQQLGFEIVQNTAHYRKQIG